MKAYVYATGPRYVFGVSYLEFLTPRERSVFDKLVEGKPNKVVARELGLSPRTVEFYRARIMIKLDVRSVAEMVRMSLVLAN